MAGLIRSTRESDGLQIILPFPLLSTATGILAGDFVTMDSSGRLTNTLSAGSNFGSGALIVGQAQQNALDDNGAIRPFLNVTLAQPGTRFWVPLYNGTPASAVFTPGTSQASNYEMRYVSATAGFAVDNSATTNAVCRIVTVSADDYPNWPTTSGAGTIQYPQVLIEFLGASSKFTGAR